MIGVAVLVTVVAIFYLEEDWRGRRAWESYKSELEAKGVSLDWGRLIPSPVPDDQNFFTASTNILIRFRKPQGDNETKQAELCSWLRITYETNSFPVFDNTKTSPLRVADLVIISSRAAAEPKIAGHAAFELTDAQTAGQVQELIRKNVGRALHGPAGYQFSEFHLDKLTPARILLSADTPPPIAALENLLPSDLDTNLGHLRLEAGAEEGTFHVLLADVHVTAAADYLKWSDQYVPALDEVREALKRPYALLPGDYLQPVMVPIPNFVTLRSVCQLLAQRAQCDYLLERPEDALREMTLVHDVCRTLKRIPAGRPITLVESMINAAVTGLYSDAVGDGLRLHAWREPQLVVLQQQLEDNDVLPLVVASLHSEEAFASDHMVSPMSPELKTALWGDSFWKRMKDPAYLFFSFAPHGWLCQNAVVYVTLIQTGIQGFDTGNQLVLPETFDSWERRSGLIINHLSPYSYLESLYLPSVAKAAHNTAYNQTLANEALVACGLERYRLARGEYPATLDALAPELIEKLPHDIIGGQPLHYRRTEDGKFLLYSVGWNKTDDGGVPGTLADVTKGDWVWKY